MVWHGPFRRQTLLGFAELLTELAIDADKVTGPVLWLHGEEDQLVPMAGSRRGIAYRNANVTEKIYPGARHEIFNELNKDEVLADTTARSSPRSPTVNGTLSGRRPTGSRTPVSSDTPESGQSAPMTGSIC